MYVLFFDSWQAHQPPGKVFLNIRHNMQPRTFHTQDNQLKPAVLVPGTLRCRLCVPISTILRKA